MAADSDPYRREHPLVRRALAECPPRHFTRPDPAARHLLGVCLVVARMLGLKLMPWQALVLRVITEMRPDGRPKYRHVTILVPRQNGKTVLMLVLLFWRLVFRPWAQVVFAGQSGQAGRDRMTETFWPRIARFELDTVFGLELRKGNWPDFKRPESGGRVVTWGGSEDANHGDTLDLAVCDEVWRHYDDVLDHSLVPTMRTRRSAQKVDVSTAGTERSSYLIDRRDKALVMAGGDTPPDEFARRRTAFFEWSAPEDCDHADLAQARACNPAVGYRLDMEEVASDLATLPEAVFRRTNLNQFVVSDEPWVIPKPSWDGCRTDSADPSGGMVVALDAEPTHRVSGHAVACDSTGRAILADRFNLSTAGDDSLLDWCMKVVERNDDVRGFALTDSGGLAGLRPKLERAVGKSRVFWYGRAERCQAAGFLYDQVSAGGRVWVERSEPDAFDRALAEATRWPKHGRDAWEFQRVHPADGDISALVALSLAVHAATAVERPPRRKFAIA